LIDIRQGDALRACGDYWRTPPELFRVLNGQWRFTLDVAADEESALCASWCLDGLSESWAPHSVWCNPPYSNILPWVEKALTEVYAETTMLLPVFTEAAWFERLIDARATLMFLKPRVRFVGAVANSPHRMMVARFCGVGGMRVLRWKEDRHYQRIETPSLFAGEPA